ncbi:DUF2069 domain-containing protein [Psychromonas antarctica]|jgi:uncharacterized membrane protein|uniref:DUF2069 domain-containing protein n=1 Tax=Psychromonas antarctica TaxID=67573 RepID=UPI001EE88416|nr:DUF2069 domain-containing protein [Psychromonas antarctica]MCG6199936.1 DUF2069 domain-containing protein [Psychromonas antarctica]
MKTVHYQLLAKSGYFGLIFLIPIWHLWLSPASFDINPWFVTSIWFIPLLFPLKGILQSNPYTYAWSGFLALFYLMHSIVILFSSESETALATVELVFTLLFLTGGIGFAKYRGRELGLSIRKKKSE